MAQFGRGQKSGSKWVESQPKFRGEPITAAPRPRCRQSAVVQRFNVAFIPAMIVLRAGRLPSELMKGLIDKLVNRALFCFSPRCSQNICNRECRDTKAMSATITQSPPSGDLRSSQRSVATYSHSTSPCPQTHPALHSSTGSGSSTMHPVSRTCPAQWQTSRQASWRRTSPQSPGRPCPRALPGSR